MSVFGHLLASLLLVLAGPAFPQTVAFPSREAAVAGLFPNQKFAEWTSTAGDWNGDGIEDLALILSEVDGPMEGAVQTRLVVLAGAPGRKYAPLAVSSNYCHAQKFYNLEAKGSSLFVSEVNKADGDGQASTTLQFRFNRERADFELIGRENSWESFGKEYGRSSVNFLAGIAIDYERVRGRIRVKKERRFEPGRLIGLSGFDCDRQLDGKPF